MIRLDRKIFYKSGRIWSEKLNRFIAEGISNGDLYKKVNLFDRTRYVHIIIAELFIPNPENKEFVNHKNGIKSDNRVENLDWVTRSENEQHAFRIGLKSHKGNNHNRRKLDSIQVKVIREAVLNFAAKDVAKYFNVSLPHIYAIKYKNTWHD